jgi:homoprotocatechuate degradation regulator HpaR
MPTKISRRNLPLLLSQAREAAISNFRPILNHYGLTEQQWRILRTLDEYVELEPWQLAGICQILSPSLTGILTRLGEMGLVRKSPHAADQRRMLISLTPKSKSLIAQIAPLVQAQYQHLEGAIGRELLDRLYGLLGEFLTACEVPVEHVDLPPLRSGRSAKTPDIGSDTLKKEPRARQRKRLASA